MSRKIKTLLTALVMLCAVPAFAKDFDWEDCWCNYGAGIKEGDMIINVGGGFDYLGLPYMSQRQYWFIPTSMVDLQFAVKMGQLPFTFGGYAGMGAFGYEYLDSYDRDLSPVYKSFYCYNLFTGAEAAYHVMLPPENLDVYGIARLGVNVPLHNESSSYTPTYVDWGTAIGATWYFGNVFGVNAEIGFPVTKIGVSLKF